MSETSKTYMSQPIEGLILILRGQKVILDSDLARPGMTRSTARAPPQSGQWDRAWLECAGVDGTSRSMVAILRDVRRRSARRLPHIAARSGRCG